MDYVATAVGATDNSKADKITQDCKKLITGDAQPGEKLMSLLDTLEQELPGAGSSLAHMIAQVGNWLYKLFSFNVYGESSVISFHQH